MASRSKSVYWLCGYDVLKPETSNETGAHRWNPQWVHRYDVFINEGQVLHCHLLNFSIRHSHTSCLSVSVSLSLSHSICVSVRVYMYDIMAFFIKREVFAVSLNVNNPKALKSSFPWSIFKMLLSQRSNMTD